MKVAIRNIGKHNEKLLALLRTCADIEIVYFADIDNINWGGSVLPVHSTLRMYEDYHKGKIDKIFMSPYLTKATIDKAYPELREAGVADEDICIPSVTRLNNELPLYVAEVDNGDFCITNWHQIRYIEFHISDSCNLNCQGCIHFSSLVPPGSLVSFSEVENDLRRLKKIVEHIEIIRVMGGEPLLNPEWQRYITLVREIYPYTDLRLATNGLLVGKLTDYDYDFLRQMDVRVDITPYKPLFGKVEEIVKRLNEASVRIHMTAPAFSFRSCLRLSGGIDASMNRATCGARCFNVYKGHMAPCPIMMYIKSFNQYFNTALPEEQPVDLSESMSFETFIKKMYQPMRLCAYCDQSQPRPWESIKNGNANKAAWCTGLE